MLWNSPKKTQSYFDTIIRTLNDVLGDPNREWLLWGLHLVGLGYHFASKKIKQISEKNSHFFLSETTLPLSYQILKLPGIGIKRKKILLQKINTPDRFSWPYALVCTLLILFQLSWNNEKRKMEKENTKIKKFLFFMKRVAFWLRLSHPQKSYNRFYQLK